MKTHLAKMLFMAVLCLGLSSKLQAQYIVNGNEIDTTFNTQMNRVFGNLDKSRIPFGLLKDYALEFTNLLSYNGTVVSDSTMVNKSVFYDIYNTLLSSIVNTSAYSGMLNSNLVDSIWYTKRLPGQIAVCGLFYQYAYLDANALNNGAIVVSNNQYFDAYNNGIWQNPYLTGKTLAFAPATEVYMGQSFNILMTDSLWLSNSKNIVDHIEVDAGDGLGYRTLTPNVPLPVAYADTGLKVWNFKLHLTDNSVLQSQSRLQVNADVYMQNSFPSFPSSAPGSPVIQSVTQGPPPNGSTPASAFYYITSSETYNGKHAGGYATVLYAPGHTSIQKPLIVVEGFDPGHYTNPEILTGGYSLINFVKSTKIIGSPLYNLLLTSYDIIFVDYYDGADDIRRNALLVKDVIRWVNSTKTTTTPNVVLGLSMGGLVSRYALKQMENAGENHQTGLFICHDSPQQGANVPVAYQYFINHMNSLYYRAGIGVGLYNVITFFSHKTNSFGSTLSLDQTPAAQQMLKVHIDGNDSYNVSVHDEWQTELTNLGYPANCRNVVLSNGSECGLSQVLQPGGLLFSMSGNFKTGIALDGLAMIAFPLVGIATGNPGLLLGVLPGSNTLTANFQMNAANLNGGNQAYYGNITYTKKLFWIVNITTTLTDRTRNAPSVESFDCVGGGLYHLASIAGSSFNLPWFGSYGINFTTPADFCFVPTPSALDISGNPSNLSSVDYAVPYSEGNPPLAPKNTPFANFVTAYSGGAANNEEHITYEVRNGQWFADELNAQSTGNYPSANCYGMCLVSAITGDPNICINDNKTYSVPAVSGAGVSYVWSVSSNLTILSGQGTPNLQVTYNNTINGAATISLTFTTQCGSEVITKSVQAGPPNASYSLQAQSDPFCTNALGNWVNIVPGNVPNVSYWEWGYTDLNNINQPPVVVNPNGGVSQSFDTFTYAGTFEIYAREYNACGGGNTVTTIVNVSDNCNGGGGFSSFAAFPNPAGSTLTITSTAKTMSTKGVANKASTTAKAPTKTPFKYQILDSKGKVWRQGESTTGDDLNIDVTDIPNNTYFLHLLVGKNTDKRQIIIQH